MATTTFQPYTGNGSNKTFNYSFPTFTASEVVVEVDGVVVDNFTIPGYQTTGTRTVTFDNSTGTLNSNVCEADGAPKNNLEVIVRRDTNVDVAKATYTAGASLKAEDLTNNQTQILRALQEEQNTPITTPRLRDGQVTSAKIKDGTIQTADIAGDQITNALIADDQIDSEHYVDQSIDTQHIKNLNVTTAKLDNDAVVASKLADDAVLTDNIVNLNVTRGKIANDAIDGTKIDDDAVDSEHIAADSLDTEHYAPNSVDATAIGPNAVTTVKILNDAVTIDKIADAAIVTAAEQANAASNDTTFLTVAAADARFFNISTGDTIKDGQAFPDNDTTIATTAAINDRIIDIVDDIGGFVPLVDEGEIPQYHPEKNNPVTSDRAGTILSIGTLTQTYTPSGGTVTIQASDLTNHSVNASISDCGSTVLSSGFGVLVETTAQTDAQYANGPVFKFHRLVPKATEVTTVAGISGNVTTVANNNANVTTVATNIASVNTTAGDIANVNTTAGNIANVNTVATNIANVNLTGGSIANVNTTAGSIANVNTTATNIASINNASANINSINNFGDTYQVHSNNPTTDGGGNALAAGDLYFDTSADELKVYNGSAWQGGVTATGSFATVTGNTFTGDNRYNDGVKLKLGTGSDLQIYHSGTSSYIDHVGSGNGHLFIRGNGTDAIILRAKTGENSLACHSDGDVSLYYDGVEKLQTLSGGVQIFGNITVSGNVDGRDLAADGSKLDTYEANGSSYLRSDAADSKTSGDLNFYDNVKATFGTGNDLEIFHTGSGSIIQNGASSGQLNIASDDALNLTSRTGTEYFFRGYTNGAAELYHNNVKKIETTSTGTTTTGQSKADVDTSLNSDTEYNGQDFGFLVSYDGGDAAGSEGNGICFAQKYASADNSTVRTGAIIGYKQQATGNFGGGLKFKTQKLGANPMGTALQLDQTQNVLLPNDNAKLQIGASQDLEIYHDANNSILKNSTGYLLLKSNSGINLGDASDTDNYLKTIKDGAVELYYDGSKKLETTSTGIQVAGRFNIINNNITDTTNAIGLRYDSGAFIPTDGSGSPSNNSKSLGSSSYKFANVYATTLYGDGSNLTGIDTDLVSDTSPQLGGNLDTNNNSILLNDSNGTTNRILLGTASDMRIYHDGSDSYIDEGGTGGLKIRSSQIIARRFDNNAELYTATAGGSIDLYYDGGLKLATTAGGVNVTGELNVTTKVAYPDNAKAIFGTGDDLEIYHNGTHSFIENSTGKIMVQNSNGNIQFEAVNGEDSCKMIPHGAVELYHDNSLKLATTGSGVNVTGSVTATSFVGSGAGLTGISAIPAGTVVAMAMTSMPSGWLVCNGAAVSRTSYADLFSAIGTTYGAGDGSSTFNLPELRGEFIRGLDNGRGIDSSRSNGSFQDHGIPAMKGHVTDAHGQSRLQTFAQSGFTNVFTGVGTSSWRTSIHAVSGTFASIMFDSTNVIPAADHVRPRNVAMTYAIKA